ncbi:hypothetical protein ABZ642_40485 [Streptomyces sp. NPDC007157]
MPSEPDTPPTGGPGGALCTNIGQVVTLDDTVSAFDPAERGNGKIIVRP